MNAYVVLGVAIVLNATGQLLLKQAAVESVEPGGDATRAFMSPWFLGGGASLAVAMLLWVLALRKIPMTIAHPISGVIFIIVPIAARMIWGESITQTRALGILAIFLGIVLVARGELW